MAGRLDLRATLASPYDTVWLSLVEVASILSLRFFLSLRQVS
jgi:hypothetical protein